jgi:23S rRNA (adenine2503-C2)-methyltransferase
MKIIAEYGNDELAKVYVAQFREYSADKVASGKFIVEFVESTQPPIPRDKKWVLIVSSMFGCPINCKFCDAGGEYAGRLSADEILEQINYMVKRRFSDGRVPMPKFKIQFARMGEPALNPAVLEAMSRLPQLIDAPGLNVSMSSVAPSGAGTSEFFENLIKVKEQYFTHGRFQLQFSIHTTDSTRRDELIPVKKWSFEDIAAYGERFCLPDKGDKKITLNFAPIFGFPMDARVVRRHFDPSKFLIKLTPLNPTVRSYEESLRSRIDPSDRIASQRIVEMFEREGYEVILSIGELDENRIGSNCGQFVQRALHSDVRPRNSYEPEKFRVDMNAS